MKKLFKKFVYDRGHVAVMIVFAIILSALVYYGWATNDPEYRQYMATTKKVAIAFGIVFAIIFIAMLRDSLKIKDTDV